MRVCGTKQVLKALAQGGVKTVYIALDADASIRAKLEEAARASGVTPVCEETMAQLGKRFGIAVGTAAAVETEN